MTYKLHGSTGQIIQYLGTSIMYDILFWKKQGIHRMIQYFIDSVIVVIRLGKYEKYGIVWIV